MYNVFTVSMNVSAEINNRNQKLVSIFTYLNDYDTIVSSPDGRDHVKFQNTMDSARVFFKLTLVDDTPIML